MNKTKKLLLVEWLDIESNPDWREEHVVAATEPRLCTSVGFEVKRTKDRLVIVATLSKEHIGDSIVIPMGCVKSIKTLKA